MRFSCLENALDHRLIDVSHRALDDDQFPISIGLRSQTQKLSFALPEVPGRFIKPQVPFSTMIKIVEKRFDATLPKPVIHQANIGETLSVIYAPYYLDNHIMDAILNKPVSTKSCDLPAVDGDGLDWHVRFLPTLCPHCGWDMKGQRDSLVLNCENCTSVFKPAQNGFTKLNAVHLPGDEQNLNYMPFWRIKADVTGISLSTYADLVRVANLPKSIQPEMTRKTFYFWTLAFKVRPRFFIKLSQIMTLVQPTGDFKPGVPHGNLHPVNLPLSEGLQSLKLSLSDIIKPRRLAMSRLPDIQIKPRSFILVYLPFSEKHHEFVQPKIGVALNKNMLAHARNL